MIFQRDKYMFRGWTFVARKFQPVRCTFRSIRIYQEMYQLQSLSHKKLPESMNQFGQIFDTSNLFRHLCKKRNVTDK